MSNLIHLGPFSARFGPNRSVSDGSGEFFFSLLINIWGQEEGLEELHPTHHHVEATIHKASEALQQWRCVCVCVKKSRCRENIRRPDYWGRAKGVSIEGGGGFRNLLRKKMGFGTHRIGANPEKSDSVSFRGPD